MPILQSKNAVTTDIVMNVWACNNSCEDKCDKHFNLNSTCNEDFYLTMLTDKCDVDTAFLIIENHTYGAIFGK